jgi:hypothetical protein
MFWKRNQNAKKRAFHWIGQPYGCVSTKPCASMRTRRWFQSSSHVPPHWGNQNSGRTAYRSRMEPKLFLIDLIAEAERLGGVIGETETVIDMVLEPRAAMSDEENYAEYRRLMERAAPTAAGLGISPAHLIRVREDAATNRIEFEVLRTSGEQGAIFDTSGNSADPALVERARQFIFVHKLTGTNAESLALLARQKPALLAQLLECGEDR